MAAINHAGIARTPQPNVGGTMMVSECGQRVAIRCGTIAAMTEDKTMHILKRDLAYTYHPSPLGDLLLAGDADSLHLISFPSGKKTVRHAAHWRRDDALFAQAAGQLDAYFAKELTRFDLPLTLDGSAFQNAVWHALATIPYGETATYGALAGHLGRPKASRAVGAANGANPLPIVLPCHRVIGANGTLTGFGGGMEAKRFLLELEGAYAVEPALI